MSKPMVRALYFLSVLLLVSACGNSQDFVAESGAIATSSPETRNHPLLLQATSGSVDATGEKLLIGLTPNGEIRLGEGGEGGTLTVEEFLDRTIPSESAPRDAELEYAVGDEVRFLPLSIESIARQDDGGLLVVALGRAVISEVSNSVAAQVSTGAINGVVSNQAGEHLPGVFLELFQGQSFRRAVISGGNGEFRFSSLAPGGYTLTASLPGFQLPTHPDIQVEQARTVNLQITLTEAARVEFSGNATLRLLP